MKFLVLALALASTNAARNREARHFWGPNMTVPKTFQNYGSVNIQGVGSMNVMSQASNNFDKLDNGFALHGGGSAYFTEGGGDMGGDPYVYWQTDLANKVFSYDIDVSQVGADEQFGEQAVQDVQRLRLRLLQRQRAAHRGQQVQGLSALADDLVVSSSRSCK